MYERGSPLPATREKAKAMFNDTPYLFCTLQECALATKTCSALSYALIPHLGVFTSSTSL